MAQEQVVDGPDDQKWREGARQMLPKLPLLREWRDWHAEPQHPAFVVEVAGMPKAGKSSAISSVRHYFRYGPTLLAPPAEGYEVDTPAEEVSLRTPGYLKDGILVDFNTWAGAYAIQELLQARHDTHHDLVLLDRGPWDAGCWLEYCQNSDKVKAEGDPEEVGRIVKFFRQDGWTTQADLHVVLVVDPAEAKRRERQERLIEATSAPTFRDDLMKGLWTIYHKQFYGGGQIMGLRQAKANACKHVGEVGAILIDTTNQEPKEIAVTIIGGIFRVLELKNGKKVEEFAGKCVAELKELLLGDKQEELLRARFASSEFLSLAPSRRRNEIPAIIQKVKAKLLNDGPQLPKGARRVAARLTAEGNVGSMIEDAVKKAMG
jgi:hypothetical protein